MIHEVTDVGNVRILRNIKLAESDWAMLADAPTDKEEWGDYRQALRDFPATWEPGPVANFPNPPGYVEPMIEDAAPEVDGAESDAG